MKYMITKFYELKKYTFLALLTANLNSKDLVVEIVLHLHDGSIWAFSNEAEDLRAQERSNPSVSTTPASKFSLNRLLFCVNITWKWSCSGDWHCGNSGMKTETEAPSVPDSSAVSGSGGLRSAPPDPQHADGWVGLWAKETPVSEWSPWLSRRRSPAACRFIVNNNHPLTLRSEKYLMKLPKYNKLDGTTTTTTTTLTSFSSVN